jgi:hypothetical protein
MTNNIELDMKCLLIEDLVRSMVLSGITNNQQLVDAVSEQYYPTNEFEMEMYSEAIIYGKLGVLN